MAAESSAPRLSTQETPSGWDGQTEQAGVPFELQEALFQCGQIPSLPGTPQADLRAYAQAGEASRDGEMDCSATGDESLGSFISWPAANQSSYEHELDHSWLCSLLSHEEGNTRDGQTECAMDSSAQSRPGQTADAAAGSSMPNIMMTGQGNAWEPVSEPFPELSPHRLEQLEARIATSEAAIQRHESLVNDFHISCQDMHSQQLQRLRQALDTFKTLVGVQRSRHQSGVRGSAEESQEKLPSIRRYSSERAIQEARLMQLDSHEATLAAHEMRLDSLYDSRQAFAYTEQLTLFRQNRTTELRTTRDHYAAHRSALQRSRVASNARHSLSGQGRAESDAVAHPPEERLARQSAIFPLQAIEQAAAVAEAVGEQPGGSDSDPSLSDSYFYSDYSDNSESWWDDSESEECGVGLAPGTFEKLHRRLATESDLERACPICLSDMKEGQTLLELPCCHVYHPDCVLPWFEMSTSCPVCKRDVEQQLFAREHEHIQHQSLRLEEATDRLSIRMEADLQSLNRSIARVMQNMVTNRFGHAPSLHATAALDSSPDSLRVQGDQRMALAQQPASGCNTSQEAPGSNNEVINNRITFFPGDASRDATSSDGHRLPMPASAAEETGTAEPIVTEESAHDPSSSDAATLNSSLAWLRAYNEQRLARTQQLAAERHASPRAPSSNQELTNPRVQRCPGDTVERAGSDRHCLPQSAVAAEAENRVEATVAGPFVHEPSSAVMATLNSSLARLRANDGQSLALTQQLTADQNTHHGAPGNSQELTSRRAPRYYPGYNNTAEGCGSKNGRCSTQSTTAGEVASSMAGTAEATTPPCTSQNEAGSHGRPQTHHAYASLDAPSQSSFVALQELLNSHAGENVTGKTCSPPFPLDPGKCTHVAPNDVSPGIRAESSPQRNSRPTGSAVTSRPSDFPEPNSDIPAEDQDSGNGDAGRVPESTRLCACATALSGNQQSSLQDSSAYHPRLGSQEVWQSVGQSEWPLRRVADGHPSAARISTDAIRAFAPSHSHLASHQRENAPSVIDPGAVLGSELRSSLPVETSGRALCTRPGRIPHAAQRPMRSLYEETDRRMSWERIGRFRASFASRRQQGPP